MLIHYMKYDNMDETNHSQQWNISNKWNIVHEWNQPQTCGGGHLWLAHNKKKKGFNQALVSPKIDML